MSTTQPPKPKRRWCRFSLRTLLIVMTVATLTFGGWVQFMPQRAQENRDRVAAKVRATEEAVAAIEKLGGTVTSKYKELRPRTWLEFDDPGNAANPVGVVTELSVDLSRPYLFNSPYYIPDGSQAQVINARLMHLKRLPNSRTLNLSGTRVTDAGLEHLKGLTNLRQLDLAGTYVTDEGVQKLQKALPN